MLEASEKHDMAPIWDFQKHHTQGCICTRYTAKKMAERIHKIPTKY